MVHLNSNITLDRQSYLTGIVQSDDTSRVVHDNRETYTFNISWNNQHSFHNFSDILVALSLEWKSPPTDWYHATALWSEEVSHERFVYL